MAARLTNLAGPHDDAIARDLSLKWGRIVSVAEIVESRRRVVGKLRESMPRILSDQTDDEVYEMAMRAVGREEAGVGQ